MSVISSLLLAFVQVVPCGSPEGEPCAFETELELRIGGLGPGVDVELTAVGGLVLGSRGRIFVLQPADQTVLVLGENGSLVRRIGRRGDGPAEFQWPSTLGWKADTLWIADRQHLRVQLVTVDGEYVRGWRYPGLFDRGYRVDPPLSVLPDGDIISRAVGIYERTAMGRASYTPVVRVDTGGVVTDTVALLSTRNERLLLSAEGGRVVGRQPLRDQPLFAATGSGSHLYVVDRRVHDRADVAQFQVTRVDATGDTIWRRDYTYTPLPLSAAAVDSIVDEIVGGLRPRARRAFGGGRRARDAVLRELYVPPSWPPVRAALADGDGRLWLRQWAVDGPREEWFVLDENGLGRVRVRLPASLRIGAARGDRLWGVRTDDLGIPYVEVYRLKRTS